MNMKRIEFVGRKLLRFGAVAGLASVVTLAGCSTHLDKSFTFTVATGDDVKVTLDMKKGYDLAQQDGTFSVTDQEGNAVVEGTFTEATQFFTYKGAVDAGTFDGTVTKMDSNTIEWTYAGDGGEELNRIVLVSDNTAVIMGSQADAEVASDAYDAIGISLAETEDD